MNLEEILTYRQVLIEDTYTADDIEQLWQNVKRLVPASAHKEALAVIQDVGGDEWYTDDDMEKIYAGLQELFGADIADETFAGL